MTARRTSRRATLAWLALSALASVSASVPAVAAEIAGGNALALAALVGQQDAALPRASRAALLALLNGKAPRPQPARPIAVSADSITCRSGNVDITAHDCTLAFGTAQRRITGRLAHELSATLIEAGIRPDGAAGSVYAALKTLACTVDAAAVAQHDGSGALCRFAPAP